MARRVGDHPGNGKTNLAIVASHRLVKPARPDQKIEDLAVVWRRRDPLPVPAPPPMPPIARSLLQPPPGLALEHGALSIVIERHVAQHTAVGV
jgi:hypothetical protein